MFFLVSAHIKSFEVFFFFTQFVKHGGKFSMPIQNTDTHGSSHGPVSDSEMHVGQIQEYQNQNSRMPGRFTINTPLHTGGGGRGEGGLLSCAVYELYGDVQLERVSHF